MYAVIQLFVYYKSIPLTVCNLNSNFQCNTYLASLLYHGDADQESTRFIVKCVLLNFLFGLAVYGTLYGTILDVRFRKQPHNFRKSNFRTAFCANMYINESTDTESRAEMVM